jgi:membrane-associated phospholipid phosphatase
MRQDLVKRFTELGDPTFLVLGALAVFFYLWVDDDRRAVARPWTICLGLCIALTVVGKLVLHLHGWKELGPWRFYSPSGHVAIATAFYGSCAMLLRKGRGTAFGVAVLGAVVVLIALLAASRMVLGLHSAPEIAAALAIGLVSLWPFQQALAERPVVIEAGQLIALLLLIGVVRVTHVDGEALVAYVAHTIDSLAAKHAIALSTGTSGSAGY